MRVRRGMYNMVLMLGCKTLIHSVALGECSWHGWSVCSIEGVAKSDQELAWHIGSWE